MRLLCILSAGEPHPSSRLRILQHVNLLNSRGIDVEVFNAKRRGVIDSIRLARLTRSFDAVLIQRKLFARFKIGPLLGSTPVLFDMDDALFEVSPDERARFGIDRAEKRAESRRSRLRFILERSRLATVGNEYLAAYASRHAPAVSVVPTAVDLAPFRDELIATADRRRDRREGVRLGWIGTRPALHYLKGLAGPLREVCARTAGVSLVQISNEFVEIPGIVSEKRTWSAQSEVTDLLDLDIGLMPLDDTGFSRGKCGFKILQYQAAALPVVCTPVGVNCTLVRDGVDGFHASNGREWVDRILRLVGDPGMARAMGRAGRESVGAGYHAGSIGGRLADLVTRVIDPNLRQGTAVPGLPGAQDRSSFQVRKARTARTPARTRGS